MWSCPEPCRFALGCLYLEIETSTATLCSAWRHKIVFPGAPHRVCLYLSYVLWALGVCVNQLTLIFPRIYIQNTTSALTTTVVVMPMPIPTWCPCQYRDHRSRAQYENETPCCSCPCFFSSSYFYFPASGQAVVPGVASSPPLFLPSIFYRA